jgi:hypothetical protein
MIGRFRTAPFSLQIGNNLFEFNGPGLECLNILNGKG